MTQEKKKGFETALTKISNTYFPMIQEQLEGNQIEMDDYAKKCVMNSISAINEALDSQGIDWSNPQLDHSNVTEILLSIASLKLNPSASPNEVYFQIRNVKRKVKGKDEWKKQIEMGIEGDGNDSILARYGRDVKQVMKFWEVREGDKFEYPSFNGIEMKSPQWTPTGQGKVVRVVYPIIKRNDIVEFHIAERHDVIKNLIAHINNNLMRATFGIAKDFYSATPAQKKQIIDKKQEIMEHAEELGLDGAIDDEEIQKHISPAWKSLQSRESMIVRKMRNNIVKKIPKDFGHTIAEMSYDKTSNFDEAVQTEVENNANQEILDIKPDKKVEPDNKLKPEDESVDVEIIEKTEVVEDEPKKSDEPSKTDKSESKQEELNLGSISDDDVPF